MSKRKRFHKGNGLSRGWKIGLAIVCGLAIGGLAVFLGLYFGVPSVKEAISGTKQVAETAAQLIL